MIEIEKYKCENVIIRMWFSSNIYEVLRDS